MAEENEAASAETPASTFAEYQSERIAEETNSEQTGASAAVTEDGSEESTSEGASAASEATGEQETAAKGSEEEEEPKGKLSGWQRHKRRLDLQRQEIEDLKRTVKDLTAKAPEKPAETPAEKPTGRPKRPRPDDFDDDASYEAAIEKHEEQLVDWKLEQRLSARDKAAEEKRQKAAATSEVNGIAEAHKKRVAEFSKTQTDYDSVMKEISDVEIPDSILLAVLSSQQSDRLTFHLAKHLDELTELIEMEANPAEVYRTVGKLEARLQPETNGRKKGYKPPPPPPSKVGSGGPPPPIEEVTDGTTYIQRRRAEVLASQKS